MEYIKHKNTYYPMSDVRFEVIENREACSLTLQMEISGFNANPIFVADLGSNGNNITTIQREIKKIKVEL